MNWIDDLIKEGEAELSVRYQQQVETNHERQFLASNAVAVWDDLKRIIAAHIEEINNKSRRTVLSPVITHVNYLQLCGADHSPVLDARFTPEAFQLVVTRAKDSHTYKLEAAGTTNIGWRQQGEDYYATSALAQHIVTQAYKRLTPPQK